ncbi:MAG: UDP-N-acetylglucosamine--N-acetylmuramyl-(pentapeptide) pyrophosphoryl-undecaprenol N-acetylglucosamine transferase, partial [Lentisphaerae bacterium]|nr:UDP-N-acetylglucosamine--N-acetylmuramyl-(pentapeptide) pyrophosphoryl-undecaprenol N-acetylglucosamine transferase [Lentisphaerota bacterium]
HLAGAKDGETVRAGYAASGVEARVFEFLSDMGLAYASADFAVCRAGAASCAELAAAGLPALLVPLPGAPRDHQTANARAAAANGGMLLQNQADLTAASLAALLTAVLHDRPRLANMKARLASGPADAAARIAGLVEDCAPAKTT